MKKSLEHKIETAWLKMHDLSEEQFNCEHNYAGLADDGYFYDHCGICQICGSDSETDADSDLFLSFCDGYSKCNEPIEIAFSSKVPEGDNDFTKGYAQAFMDLKREIYG